jgi:ABC-type phosphate transport system substrate-binding protein
MTIRSMLMIGVIGLMAAGCGQESQPERSRVVPVTNAKEQTVTTDGSTTTQERRIATH